MTAPQPIEQTLPSGNVLLRNFPAGLLKIAPPQLGAVNLLRDEDVGMPDDEEQPEERNGMSAAVAIISCSAGAYWTARNRSLRRVAAVLPAIDEEM